MQTHDKQPSRKKELDGERGTGRPMDGEHRQHQGEREECRATVQKAVQAACKIHED